MHLHNLRALGCLFLAATGVSTSAQPLVVNKGRNLQFGEICGYSPRTKISDEAALDLDQKAMVERLSDGDITTARKVYEMGGHSKPVAILTLLQPPGTHTYPAGTRVIGESKYGRLEVSGTLMGAASWSTSKNENVTVEVEYILSDDQQAQAGCQVGGLYSFDGATLDGCYIDGVSSVEFVPPDQEEGTGRLFAYTYDIRRDNVNYRTLESLSTNSASQMRACHDCPYYYHFQKFVDYYGQADFGDEWVLKASYATKTDFAGGRGNMDFSELLKIGIAEAMMTGTVALNIFLYVIKQMEDAVALCYDACDNGAPCNHHGLHALDQAVAFYCGSTVDEDDQESGFFLFTLANKRAMEFKTAGRYGDAVLGSAFVNTEIMDRFEKAQASLEDGDCDGVDQYKEEIANLMKVPLIQSVLRYTYIRDFETVLEPEDIDQAESLGASFAAALLPFVHSCSEEDAKLLHKNTRVGSDIDSVSFSDVKTALERNYACLGVTCDLVGGIWTDDGEGYAAGGEPCGRRDDSLPQNRSDSDRRKPVVGLLIASVASVFVVGLGCRYCRRRRLKRKRVFRASTTNIAAVSEIA